MLKIRFQRVGRKNDASFRIVVTEHTSGPKSGKNVEQIGSYNPKTKAITLDKERAAHWMGVGAQLSDSLHNLFIKEGVIEGSTKNPLPKKAPILKEEDAEEAPAEEAAPEGEAETAEEAPAEENAPEEAPKEEVAEEAPAEEEKKEDA